MGQAGQLTATQVVVQEVQRALVAQALLAHRSVQIYRVRLQVQTYLEYQHDQVPHLRHRVLAHLQVQADLIVPRGPVRHHDEVARVDLNKKINRIKHFQFKTTERK